MVDTFELVLSWHGVHMGKTLLRSTSVPQQWYNMEVEDDDS